VIDQHIKEVEDKGGKIGQRYDQDFMKGFSAWVWIRDGAKWFDWERKRRV